MGQRQTNMQKKHQQAPLVRWPPQLKEVYDARVCVDDGCGAADKAVTERTRENKAAFRVNAAECLKAVESLPTVAAKVHEIVRAEVSARVLAFVRCCRDRWLLVSPSTVINPIMLCLCVCVCVCVCVWCGVDGCQTKPNSEKQTIQIQHTINVRMRRSLDDPCPT